MASFLAVLQIGGVVTPLAPGSSAAALAAMIADSGARLLLHDTVTAAALDEEGFRGPTFGCGWRGWTIPPSKLGSRRKAVSGPARPSIPSSPST
ncbi:AMP-binding protein [Phenylobacterium sp. J426]|uniref:AMP-binding protein n=1 Tax=Phenylobacterium sp. J426 TaxID=2898439 RepID=UPI0027E27C7D|nr:AMP-binding protein [Phenylobacterium sp. J426]